MIERRQREWKWFGGLAAIAALMAFLANITTIVGGAASVFGAHEPPKPELSGQWHIKLLTESSLVASHREMELTYGIDISDINGVISGEGTLVCENGRYVYGTEMRRVTLAGSYKNDKLMLHWTEFGRHQFQVHMDLQMKNDQGAGTFSSSIAKEAGNAAIVRRHEAIACTDPS